MVGICARFAEHAQHGNGNVDHSRYQGEADRRGPRRHRGADRSRRACATEPRRSRRLRHGVRLG